MVTLYSTPTCAPCRVAEKRLIAAGITVNRVDLTEEPETLAALKAELDSPVVHTPTFRHDGELQVGIAHLSNIIRSVN